MATRPFSRHTTLLRSAPSFRLLFLATLGSGLGTWLAVIALTVDIFDRTGSGGWVSALLIASFLPSVGIGLLLGPLLDRLSRQRLMIGADLVRAVVFCVLPFLDSAHGIVALAAVAGLASGFFTPAVYAGLPNLVPDESLSGANALFRSVEYLASAIGPVLGGVLVAVASPDVAYWLNAATFVVSAVLIARIPQRLLQSEVATSRGHWHDLADGFSVVLRSRALLIVLVAWSLAVVGNAGVNVAEVVLAKVTFSAGNVGFGLLAAGSGVGLVVGSLGAGGLLDRRGVVPIYAGGLALMGLGVGAAAISPNVWVAIVCVVVSGLGNGVAVVCNSLLVQRGAPDRLRGRAFTVIMSTNFAVLGLAMVAAGRLTDTVGARWVWGGSAVAAGLAAVAALAIARGAVDIRGTSEAQAEPPPIAPAVAPAREPLGPPV